MEAGGVRQFMSHLADWFVWASVAMILAAVFEWVFRPPTPPRHPGPPSTKRRV